MSPNVASTCSLKSSRISLGEDASSAEGAGLEESSTACALAIPGTKVSARTQLAKVAPTIRRNVRNVTIPDL